MKSSSVNKVIVASVWMLRIIIGLTFVISGVVKMIDPYGFIYKIQQYLAVWNWSVPESLVVVAAVGISGVEFLCGLSLAVGSYKRSCVFVLLTMMAFMLPLSVYIAIANPVSDCGCFGDFIVISNIWTCIKNIFITASLWWLILYNSKVRGIYWPYLQWIQITLCVMYIAILGIIGYHRQPLIDFRPYKVGTMLLPDRDDGDSGVGFIYERNGEKREFGAEELPDSTWVYVDRVEHGVIDESALTLYSISEDVDVSDDVANDISEGDVLVLLIPDVNKAGVANTYTINELNSYMVANGGSMIAIIGSDREDTENWIDLAMAEYPVYLAESTAIKTIARGNMAVVYTHDGIIRWKRSLWSVGTDLFDNHKISDWLNNENRESGSWWFWMFTIIFVSALSVLWIISRSALGLSHHFSQKSKKKNVNLQSIGASDVASSDRQINKDFINNDKEKLQ